MAPDPSATPRPQRRRWLLALAYLIALPSVGMLVVGSMEGNDDALLGLAAATVGVALALPLAYVWFARGRTGAPPRRRSLVLAAGLGVVGTAFTSLAMLVRLAAGMGAPGRPLRAGWRPRLARRDPLGSTWTGRDAGVAGPATDSAAFTEGLAEHASIAAFARLSLQLLANGAPPGLLRRTHDAAIDEIRHAELFFGRAALGSPGGFPDAACATVWAPTAARPEELLVETFVDGCLGEARAVAGLEARAATEDAAGDAAFARALRDVAADERRHAELAWDILAWGLALDTVDAASVRRRCEAAAAYPDDDVARAARGRLGRLGGAHVERTIHP
jgi:hypothetical protein